LILSSFSGCIQFDSETSVSGNIGEVTVSGDIDKVSIDDYILETLVFNRTDSSIEEMSGIVSGDAVNAYKVTGSASNTAGSALSEVTITARFFGGVSKGVFVLYSDTQTRYNVAANQNWDFDFRFKYNNNNFSTIKFIDFVISAE
jgi:hypothetical protein